MPRFIDENEELKADDEKFDRMTRMLVLADLRNGDSSASERPGAEFRMPGAEVGLPGGKYIYKEEEVFQTYDLRVRSEAATFAPPALLNDDGTRVPLSVDVRARRAEDFTGVEIRKHKADADPEKGEVNQLAELNEVAGKVLEFLGADLTEKASSNVRADARRQLANVYAKMAEVLRK
jgi:hypothetical protein